MFHALTRSLRPALRKRFVVAAVLGGVVFSSVYAFAATLGVTSNQLSAGNAAVTSCVSTSVNASYLIAYDSTLATNGGYKVSSVVLTGIGGCSGKSITAELTNTAAASLSHLTYGPISSTEATAGTVTIPVTGPPLIAARDVAGISVAIAG